MEALVADTGTDAATAQQGAKWGRECLDVLAEVLGHVQGMADSAVGKEG